MALTDQEIMEMESYWCEYCCNFDKEHCGMDGMALCKITNTLAYSEESGENCPFFNKPKSRFVELPCAVGDTVYVLRSRTSNGKNLYLREERISHYRIFGERTFMCFDSERMSVADYEYETTVFFTKEKAEKALAERSEGKKQGNQIT